MSFSKFLKSNILISKYSRKSLIAKLNLYHDEFENLDTVTLSRWVTGTTIPSLFKQVLICVFYNVDVYDFIQNNNYTNNTTSRSFEDKFKLSMKKIELSSLNVSYNYNKNDSSIFVINKYDHKEYSEKFKIFYENFDIYRGLFNFIKKNSINPRSVTFEEVIGNNIVSHDSLTYIDDKLSFFLRDLFDVSINLNDLWLANISFHRSEKSFKILFMLASYFLYRESRCFEYLSLVRGEEAFLNFNEIGYKQIGKTIFHMNEKFYLVRCDLLKVISNSLVLKELNLFLNENDIKYIYENDIQLTIE